MFLHVFLKKETQRNTDHTDIVTGCSVDRFNDKEFT